MRMCVALGKKNVTPYSNVLSLSLIKEYGASRET